MSATPLSAWDNFYVIVGSAAGALTGLLFVVITLVAGRYHRQASSWGTDAFTTPTVVQFGAVLFVAALLSAPWPALTPPALLLGLTGLAGIGYCVIVLRRMRRRSDHEPVYEPIKEDLVWYVAVPVAGYILLLVAAFVLPAHSLLALFGVGAALLLLLLVGIRNAWDLITYIGIEVLPQQDATDPPATLERAQRAENESAE